MCNQLTDREEKVGCLYPSGGLHPFLTPLFLLQLYHNMLEQTDCDYANTSAMKAVSAREAQTKSKAANEYAHAHPAAGSREQTCELDAEQEKLLKLSDA